MKAEEIIAILNKYKETYKLGFDGEYSKYLAISEDDFGLVATDIIQSLQQSEWVKVEERLPKYNQYCLITYPKAPIPLTAIYKGESSWLGIDTEIWLAKEDITHWMPLPTPPNK